MLKRKRIKQMSEHAETGKRVMIYYKNKDTDREGCRDGVWTGTSWALRVPYEAEKYAAAPENLELIGWVDCGLPPKPYEL